MTPARRHDILAALGAITMAIDVLHSFPVATEQAKWLDIIKRNTDAALALVGGEEVTP